MSGACGCCDGVHAVTPAAVVNRAGLDAIHARIGTHATFLETMLARLSSADYPQLAGLRTRDPADPGIALIDAWATIADVLTFYQERIANEAYLRTATERRSLIALARLIGYVPKPGVAASVYLAFGLEAEATSVTIPAGTKANSIPAPGETMEAFETGEAILAKREWSAMRPRVTRSQTLQTLVEHGLYLAGTATGLKPGSLLLVRVPTLDRLVPVRAATVTPDDTAGRTHVTFADDATDDTPVKARASLLNRASLDALLRPRTLTPANATRLSRSVATSFGANADALPQLLATFRPTLASSLYAALRNAGPQVAQAIEVHAMRIEARAFGHNAPLRLTGVGTRDVPPTFAEWTIASPWGNTDQEAAGGARHHDARTILLDNDYDVAPDSFVAIQREGAALPAVIAKASLAHVSLTAYGLSGKSIVVTWTEDAGGSWLREGDTFAKVRAARAYLGSERLALAGMPIADDVAGGTIELDGVYDGLAPGRWLIVEGERSDIPDGGGNPIPGIRAAELVMLAAVDQTVRAADPPRDASDDGTSVRRAGFAAAIARAASSTGPQPRGPEAGGTLHTVLTIAGTTAAGGAGLAYRYRRNTVVLRGNVAPATHGETRTETLGAGNAATPFQHFTLKLSPLTYVSAATPSGVASTLALRVDDLLWHEAPTLAAARPADRVFVTRTGDDDRATATFGDGEHGQRIPSGRDNVTARYRSGIGRPGNVGAGQISLLAARPLGVKDVVNPIRASGGADREGASAIRRNAPVAIMALDRLVSVPDYADFARSFGGVGKAAATRDRGTVAVVIAGIDDIPVETTSDLFRNLKDALHRFGDPTLRVTLAVRERLVVVLKAGVRLDPDYLWEAVEPKIRAALLATLGFEQQALGGPVFLATAIRTIQSIPGVGSVDVDVFDTIAQGQVTGDFGDLAATLTSARPRLAVAANQIAYLSADVADTLILQELPS